MKQKLPIHFWIIASTFIFNVNDNVEFHKERKEYVQSVSQEFRIPLSLYMIIDKSYFRIHMFPKNLEVLKNVIENNVYSLCNKLNPSLFMCLLLRRFAWANKCDLSINHTNGNITEHAYRCNTGASIFLSLNQIV